VVKEGEKTDVMGICGCKSRLGNLPLPEMVCWLQIQAEIVPSSGSIVMQMFQVAVMHTWIMVVLFLQRTRWEDRCEAGVGTNTGSVLHERLKKG